MRDRMLEDMPIIRHGRVIGSVITNSVKVGSDGFYADIYVVDNYADVKLEFKDLSWNGFPCDGNKWVVESIAQVVMAPKT